MKYKLYKLLLFVRDYNDFKLLGQFLLACWTLLKIIHIFQIDQAWLTKYVLTRKLDWLFHRVFAHSTFFFYSVNKNILWLIYATDSTNTVLKS